MSKLQPQYKTHDTGENLRRTQPSKGVVTSLITNSCLFKHPVDTEQQ